MTRNSLLALVLCAGMFHGVWGQEPGFGDLERVSVGSSATQATSTSTPDRTRGVDFGSPGGRPLSGTQGAPPTAEAIVASLDPKAQAPKDEAFALSVERRPITAADWKPPFTATSANPRQEAARRAAWNEATQATHALLSSISKTLICSMPNGLYGKAFDKKLLDRPALSAMEAKLELAAWNMAARFQAAREQAAASQDPVAQQKLFTQLAAEAKQVQAAAAKLVDNTLKAVEGAPPVKLTPAEKTASAETLKTQAAELVEVARNGTDKKGRTRDTGAPQVGRVFVATRAMPVWRLPKQGEAISANLTGDSAYRVVAVLRDASGTIVGYEVEQGDRAPGGLRYVCSLDAKGETALLKSFRPFRARSTFVPGPAPVAIEGPGAERFEPLVEACRAAAAAAAKSPSTASAAALAEAARALHAFCQGNKADLHRLPVASLRALVLKLLEALGQVKRLTLAAHGQPDVAVPGTRAPASGLGLDGEARKRAGFELGTSHNLMALVVAMIGERERFDQATGGTSRTLRLGNFYSAGTNDKQAVADADLVFTGPYALLKLETRAAASEKTKLLLSVTGLNYSAPPAAGGFQNGFAIYVLDTSHADYGKLAAEMSEAQEISAGDRRGACHQPLASCPSFKKELVLASKTRSMSEGGSAQAFAAKGLSKESVTLEFDVPERADRVYALYIEAAASSVWQPWIDYDEVRIDSIRAPNGRFIRPVDRDAFRILIDKSGSMAALFPQAAASLQRQFAALGPSMRDMFDANAPVRPVFLFNTAGSGPAGLNGLKDTVASGSTDIVPGLQYIQGGSGKPSYQPAKPWVLVILSDFGCSTCFEKQNLGQALFAFEPDGKIGINRAAWPQLVEVHLIAVNDIVPGANRCTHPAWFRESFGPGTPPAEGRETSVYFSRPANTAALDRQLADFLGQIRANLRVGPAEARQR